MNLEQLKKHLIDYLADALNDTQDVFEKNKIKQVITTFSNLKESNSYKIIKQTIECAFDYILLCSRPCDLQDLLRDYKNFKSSDIDKSFMRNLFCA